MENKELAEALNDLVKINNDRVTGYEKAAHQTKTTDVDLQVIFLKMAEDSRAYVKQLNEKIIPAGGDPASDTTVAGKIYRVWMGIKNLFTGSERKSILESCEFGEEAAQKAYDEALQSDAEMNVEIRQLITSQKRSLQEALDTIKKLRNMQTV